MWEIWLQRWQDRSLAVLNGSLFCPAQSELPGKTGTYIPGSTCFLGRPEAISQDPPSRQRRLLSPPFPVNSLQPRRCSPNGKPASQASAEDSFTLDKTLVPLSKRCCRGRAEPGPKSPSSQLCPSVSFLHAQGGNEQSPFL